MLLLGTQSKVSTYVLTQVPSQYLLYLRMGRNVCLSFSKPVCRNSRHKVFTIFNIVIKFQSTRIFHLSVHTYQIILILIFHSFKKVFILGNFDIIICFKKIKKCLFQKLNNNSEIRQNYLCAILFHLYLSSNRIAPFTFHLCCKQERQKYFIMNIVESQVVVKFGLFFQKQFVV